MSQPTRKRKRSKGASRSSDYQRVNFSVQMPMTIPITGAVYRARDLTGWSLSTFSPIFSLLTQTKATFKITRMRLQILRKSWQTPPATDVVTGLEELVLGFTHETQSTGGPQPSATAFDYNVVLAFPRKERSNPITNYQLQMGTRQLVCNWMPKAANDFTFKACASSDNTGAQISTYTQNLNYTWGYVVLAGRNGTTSIIPSDNYDIVIDVHVIFSGSGNKSGVSLSRHMCLFSSDEDLESTRKAIEAEQIKRSMSQATNDYDFLSSP